MIKSQKENLSHLKAAFEEKNEKEFRFLLETYAYNTNVSLHNIGIESSLIEHILATPKSSNFIKICFNYGENYHKKNSDGFYLLDYAIKSLCAENLKTLVDHLTIPALQEQTKQIVSNSEIANKNNHLHDVLLHLSSENYEECNKIIEILLKLGCNPNHFNAENTTPFEFLLNKVQNNLDLNDLIETFLNNSIPRIEVSDSDFNRNFVSSRNSEKLVIRDRSTPDVANLFDLINQGNENEFISMLQRTELQNQIPYNFTDLMKKCIEMNFTVGVKKLLQMVPDANRTYMKNGCDIDSLIPTKVKYEIDNKPLLFYAIKLNRSQIVKVFLDMDCAQFQSEHHCYSVLHEICSMKNVECDKDFKKCFNLIVKNRRCDYNLINAFDHNGKTPLMYACENDHKEIIYELLRRGAYIGHECIVTNLCEEILKKVLDECIVPTSDINDQNCAVQINCKFLIPPKYSLTRNDETRALKLIASQPRFKNLMTHPVLTSYLELKWKRVNVLVYIALFLYFIFFVYLSLFILRFFSNDLYNGVDGINSRFGVDIDHHLQTDAQNNEELRDVNIWHALFGNRKKREAYESKDTSIIYFPTEEPEETSTTQIPMKFRNRTRRPVENIYPKNSSNFSIEKPQRLQNYIKSYKISYSICLIGTLILTLCEIIQLIFSWRTYFFKLSNWVDCTLLFLAYVVLLNYFAYDVDLFRKLRAVLFLVISFQSFILLSRVSKLSLQLEIFKKVSRTFIKFIMLYFMLLFAFAMAFNTLYGSEISVKNSEDDKKEDNDDDENGFKTIMMSIITVIRMMLSDFDKMKLEPDDKFNSIIFLAFILLITIILFNLLNALAINDTQQIMKSAEIVDVRKRIAIVGNCEFILAFLKVEILNVYSNLIPNGQIILKINKDNYVRIRYEKDNTLPSEKIDIIENEYIHMVPLCDETNRKSLKLYTKVRIPKMIIYENLYAYIERFNILNPFLTLGNENIEKIIKHIKNSIDSDN
ncbi:transient receptor potential cation channel protein painless-like [Chironomus tepperi]|uniref:transient receptor potential cation channel protein painless-like n=1 Tax=Chironomus tepperi TaxID=113505 RepID=UPI00391F5DB9